jgi:hypothetical protein
MSQHPVRLRLRGTVAVRAGFYQQGRERRGWCVLAQGRSPAAKVRPKRGRTARRQCWHDLRLIGARDRSLIKMPVEPEVPMRDAYETDATRMPEGAPQISYAPTVSPSGRDCSSLLQAVARRQRPSPSAWEFGSRFRPFRRYLPVAARLESSPR